MLFDLIYDALCDAGVEHAQLRNHYAEKVTNALVTAGVRPLGPACSGAWDEQTTCVLPPGHLGWHCSAPAVDDEGVVLPGATWSQQRAELVEAEELTS
jgi:hypothetical protein